jgi:hypothetical protein
MQSPGPNRLDHERKPLGLAFQSMQNIVQVLSSNPGNQYLLRNQIMPGWRDSERRSSEKGQTFC